MPETAQQIHLEDLARSEWKWYRFDQIASSISERVEPSETDLDIYVGLEHLDAESIHIKRFGTPADVKGTKLKVYPGDVIFGKRRAYQRKAAIAEFEGICSAHAMVLRANPEVIEPKLFPFFLHSDTFMHRAIDISVGSLSPTINWKTLRQQEFLLPPKDQQARLAELLWAADEVVERGKETLQKVQTTILSYREKVLLDKDHQRVKLNELLNGITAGKSLNGINKPIKNEEKGVLKVSAVGPNGFDPIENKVLNDQEGFLDKFSISKGDLLITRANTTELVGRVCLVKNDHPHLMLSDKTLRLETNDKVNKTFLSEVLASKELRRQIEAYATGTGGAMKNISQQEIKSLKIPYPEMKEQVLLADEVKAMYKSKDGLQTSILSMKLLFKSLLNQIFSE
ncbi:MAG: restriction endonuclease subunit S [Bacteroidota bacterium]